MRSFPSCYHRFRTNVPFSFRPAFVVSCALLSLFAAFSTCAQSTPQESVSLDDALRQLADRIATIPNLHGPCRLEFVTDANFAAEAGKDLQQTFRSVLESHRIAVSDDSGAPVLRIGIAETPTHVVLSASTHLAEKDEVRMLTFARASFRSASLPVAAVRLEKQLVYQTLDRLLDASSFWNGSSNGMALLVDRNGELEILRVDVSGNMQQIIPLNTGGPFISRDLRAELSLQSDLASVLLPGKACQLSFAAPGEPKCHATKPSWRAATILTPSCNTGGWKLQADGADWTSADVLQAVPDDAAKKGSATIVSDFPGPIISVNGEQNPSGALVVTRNLRTGNYEVYKITLACAN